MEREGGRMNQEGLWELFCRTGLPEAWLALAAQRREDVSRRQELAKTAFQPRTGKV